MIRGAKSENGNQIVIQNTQELLNLLNRNNSKFTIAQNHNENIVERLELGTLNELKIEAKSSDNVNNHLNSSHLLKDNRIVIKSLDKSHSFLVVRNGNRNVRVSNDSKIEKEDLKTSSANEHVKESFEKLIPTGIGKFKNILCLVIHHFHSEKVIHAFKFKENSFSPFRIGDETYFKKNCYHSPL